MTSIPRLRSASQLRQPAQAPTSSTATTTASSPAKNTSAVLGVSLLRKPSGSLRAPAVSSITTKRSTSQLAASTRQATRSAVVAPAPAPGAPGPTRHTRTTSMVPLSRLPSTKDASRADSGLKRVPSLLKQPSKPALPTVRPVRSHLPLGSARTVSSSSTQRRALQRATSISGLSAITSSSTVQTKLSSPSASPSIGSATPTPLAKSKPLQLLNLKNAPTLRDSPSKLPTPLRRTISTSVAATKLEDTPIAPRQASKADNRPTKRAAVPDTPLMPRFNTSGPGPDAGHWALGASLIKDTDLYTSRLHGPGVGRLSDMFSPIKPAPGPAPALARPASRPLLSSTKPSITSQSSTTRLKARPVSVIGPRTRTPLAASTPTPLEVGRGGKTDATGEQQSGEMERLRGRVDELEKGEKQLLLENQVLQEENKRLLEEKKAWATERDRMVLELDGMREEKERLEKEVAAQVVQAPLSHDEAREDDLAPLRASALGQARKRGHRHSLANPPSTWLSTLAEA